jgi:transposase
MGCGPVDCGAASVVLAAAKYAHPLWQWGFASGAGRADYQSAAARDTLGQNDRSLIRQSLLEAYLPFLDEQWTSGSRNGAELWRRLQARGFRGSLRTVGEWATRRRRAERTRDQQLHKVPSARTIARLMTTARDHLSKADTVTIAAIETGVPMLKEARSLIDRFHVMIRKKIAADLDPWIADASASPIASFATGVTKDRAAVRAALTETVVKWPDRGADHKAQAGQAADVWARQARPAAGKASR